MSSRFHRPYGDWQDTTTLVVISVLNSGEMAEWSNAAVSKTVVLQSRDRGFESPSLRNYKKIPSRHKCGTGFFFLPGYSTGIMGIAHNPYINIPARLADI